jgi:hypothetical protein
MPGTTAFRGPLKHVHRGTAPFGTNPPGGPTSMGAQMPYLTGCSLEDVDNLVVLPYGNADDTPRQFGWAWAGTNFPGPYTSASSVGGITATLGASLTDAAIVGGGIVSTTGVGAPSQNKLVGATNMQVLAGKRMWFETRLRCATVTSTAFLLGWFDAVPADITGALGATNGIFFLKPYAGNELSANVRAAGTSTQVTAVIAATGQVPATVFGNATDISFGILVDASLTAGGVAQRGAISFYVNGRFAAQVGSADANMPTALMSYALVNQTTGGAVATTYRQSLCQSEF